MLDIYIYIYIYNHTIVWYRIKVSYVLNAFEGMFVKLLFIFCYIVINISVRL